MLSVKNLTKIYKTKGGVEVRALDGVSIDFESTGMVFLLGKSGSGKSTLLNVAGGLDMPDSGEVIVKGKSSKDFSKADFDNYRNTFIGFIFQEYNILNEFNVEQNIALALQLQGKKFDKAAVNELLEKVDLKGLGKRKPTTLSGGQKQRVAIARALIKEPEIIMADEPTGALDSNTGKQVFDTLKKLSKEKLVIIVSHDREFAEQYGDRIIELKDGKVLSDTTKTHTTGTEISSNVVEISDDTVRVKDWSKLTYEDFDNIKKAMAGSTGEVIISGNSTDIANFKKVSKISDDGKKECFVTTDTDKIEKKDYDGKKTKFLKSHMPLSRTIKIGASSLKSKPIRLFFTVLLCFISFSMFGVLSAMMMYDAAYTTSVSMQDAAYTSVALSKQFTVKESNKQYENGLLVYEYEYDNKGYTGKISKNEVNELNSDGRLNFAGVFNYGLYGKDYASYLNVNLTYSDSIGQEVSETYYNGYSIYGFSDCGKEYLSSAGLTLEGSYPVKSNEIAISAYMANAFVDGGFKTSDGNKIEIKSPSDMIGKSISIYDNYKGGSSDENPAYTITGIFSADVTDERLDVFKDENKSQYNQLSQTDKQKYSELMKDYAKMLPGIVCVSDSFYESNARYFTDGYDVTKYSYGIAVEVNQDYLDGYDITESTYVDYYDFDLAKTDSERFAFYGNDFKALDNSSLTLNKNEVIVSLKNSAVRDAAYGAYNYYQDKQYEDGEKFSRYSELYTKYENYYYGNDFTMTASELSEFWEYINTYVQDDEYYFDRYPLPSVAYMKNYNGQTAQFTVKGFFVDLYESNSSKYIFVDGAFDDYESTFAENDNNYETTYTPEYTPPADGMYEYIITPTDNSLSQVSYMLEERENGTLRYAINNSVYNNNLTITSMLEQMSLVFLIMGLVLAVLSALMLFNFISVSISMKKKEIGILRAVGARGIDVFKIFFAEALIIALICFLLSAIGAGVLCFIFNGMFMDMASIAVLNYNIVNIAIILGISVGVSFIATLLPVYFISRKSPVESIRAL